MDEESEKESITEFDVSKPQLAENLQNLNLFRRKSSHANGYYKNLFNKTDSQLSFQDYNLSSNRLTFPTFSDYVSKLKEYYEDELGSGRMLDISIAKNAFIDSTILKNDQSKYYVYK